MKRLEKGRGLFYHRDSGGKHEKTPAEYLRWACGRSHELGLKFDGTVEAISAMIQNSESHRGDIFLDYDVCGNLLSRRGLDRMVAEVAADLTISHILIPRRDRLARPDNPLDGVALENSFRSEGITLVYMNRVCPPLPKGKRWDIGDVLTGVVEFDNAGKDRRDLAQKILFAQLALAKAGYSIGGRPPFAFCRWLASNDGTLVRKLEDGERVRRAGHSVVWLPEPDDHPKMKLVRRIRDMLETIPASRVAAMLTAEGIPSPDAGRMRKDNGILHPVSGVWHQPTVVNIGRNSLLVGIIESGRRSMGDQLRFTSDGPRELSEDDYRTDGKPKVTRNHSSVLIRSNAHFKAVVDQEQHDKLTAILDARAGSQRGKPRSQDPTKNPLGARVFDMACCWPMYRTPYSQSFRYVCGHYQQSHGQKCAHNHVDGPTATRFGVSCLRQRVVFPGLQAKLRDRLRQLAERELKSDQSTDELVAKKAELLNVKAQLEKVGTNMALANTPDQFQVVSGVFNRLSQQQGKLETEIDTLKAQQPSSASLDTEIDAAMGVLERLPDLVACSGDFSAVGEAFRLINLRIFLNFEQVQVKKRTLNKLKSGVVTFGSASPPINIYNGPTSHDKIMSESAAMIAADPGGDVTLPDHVGNGGEGKSLGNVNRGDRI